jgi:hypothetical protein
VILWLVIRVGANCNVWPTEPTCFGQLLSPSSGVSTKHPKSLSGTPTGVTCFVLLNCFRKQPDTRKSVTIRKEHQNTWWNTWHMFLRLSWQHLIFLRKYLLLRLIHWSLVDVLSNFHFHLFTDYVDIKSHSFGFRNIQLLFRLFTDFALTLKVSDWKVCVAVE